MSGQSPPDRTTDCHLDIRLLRWFQVTANGRVIDDSAWRLSKARSLLKLLALSPGNRLHREQVIDSLWPDSPLDAATNNLHQTIFAARRAIGTVIDGQAIHLSRHDHTVFLDPPGGMCIDVDAFREAARHAHATSDVVDYYTAIRMYTGDLLPEDLYEDWIEPHRHALRETMRGLLLELSLIHRRRSEPILASDALRRASELHPLDEPINQALIETYLEAGMPRQAQHQYDLFQEALLQELGIEPDEQSRTLQQRIQRQLHDGDERSNRHSSPAPMTISLPRFLTSFVGRDVESQELCTLISSEDPTSRLITITGAAGSGKTRLAIETAFDLQGDFPDGIYFVDLSGLTSPDQVLPAIGRVLDIPEIPGRTPLASLELAIGMRRMLLILDNFESILSASGAVVQLVAGCPEIVAVVTSREILEVQGERPFFLAPLPVSKGNKATSEQSTPSVQLLFDRASMAGNSIPQTTENLKAAGAIGRSLDGLPLAIELAAAQVPDFSLPDLASELDNRLSVLTTGPRDLPPRQRSLRSAIDGSYALLPPAEQRLFRDTGVFVGGFTLDAARAIHPQQAAIDLESRLRALQRRNLIQQDRGLSTGSRYSMLETIREFATERLEESGETAALRQRHLHYYLQFAAEIEPKLASTARHEWLPAVRTDWRNIRSALEWAVANDDLESARLLYGRLWMWYLREASVEGRQWAEHLIPDQTGRPSPGNAWAHVAAATSAFITGELYAMRHYVDAGIPIAREADQPRALAILFAWRNLITFENKNEVDESICEVSALNDRLDDDAWILGWTYVQAAQAYITVGKFAEAARSLEQGIAIGRQLDEPWMLGIAGQLQCLQELLKSNIPEALDICEASLPLLREDGESKASATACFISGSLARLTGNIDLARDRLVEAVEVGYRLADYGTVMTALTGLAGVLMQDDDYTRAATVLGGAEQLKSAGYVHIFPMADALNRGIPESAAYILTDQDLNAAWKQGTTMPERNLIEYALGRSE